MEKGDIVGFKAAGSNILAFEDAPAASFVALHAPPGTSYAAQSWAAGNYFNFPDGQGVSAHAAARHMLRAHVVRP